MTKRPQLKPRFQWELSGFTDELQMKRVVRLQVCWTDEAVVHMSADEFRDEFRDALEEVLEWCGQDGADVDQDANLQGLGSHMGREWALYQYGVGPKDWAIAIDDEAARRCLNEHYMWPEVLMGEVSVITPDLACRIPWVDEDGERIGSLWDAALQAMRDASEAGVDAMYVGSTEF